MASKYAVQRKASINAPAQTVFDRIATLKRWPEWSPWQDLDPNMEVTYFGTDGAVGGGYSWTGNRKAGAGRLELTSVDAPGNIKADLEFLKPFKSQSTLEFDLQSAGDSTTNVTWTMEPQVNLMTKVMNVFGMMDRMVGKDFEKGLDRLKKQSES